jgi:hypothetical protein
LVVVLLVVPVTQVLALVLRPRDQDSVRAALQFTAPHTLYCTVLHCTALYCTVLHCTVLHCTVLYCTSLYSTAASHNDYSPYRCSPCPCFRVRHHYRCRIIRCPGPCNILYVWWASCARSTCAPGIYPDIRYDVRYSVRLSQLCLAISTFPLPSVYACALPL